MNQLVGRSKMNQLLQQLKKGSSLKGTKLNEMETKLSLRSIKALLMLNTARIRILQVGFLENNSYFKVLYGLNMLNG